MTTAIRLTRSESRKLFLSRTYLGAAAISVGLALFSVFVDAAVAGKNGQPRLGTAKDINHLLQVGAVTCIAMLVVGILSSGGEYRHHTIVSTLLVAPRRGGVVAAKAVSVFLAGCPTERRHFRAIASASVYGILMREQHPPPAERYAPHRPRLRGRLDVVRPDRYGPRVHHPQHPRRRRCFRGLGRLRGAGHPAGPLPASGQMAASRAWRNRSPTPRAPVRPHRSWPRRSWPAT